MIVNNSSQIKATPVSYELSLFEILSGVAHYCPVLSCTAINIPKKDTLGLQYNDIYHFPHYLKIQNKMRAFLRILLLK